MCALETPETIGVNGAVTALGKVGTIASVEALREAGANQAVAQIQSRAVGGGGGELSFYQSDGVQGGLSMADSQDGQLTETPPATSDFGVD